MATSIGIGFSQATDPREAALQASVQAKHQLNSPQVDLVLLLTTPYYSKPDTLAIVHDTLRPAKCIGSSAGGIILSEGIAGRGIAVLAMASDDIRLGIGTVDNMSNGDLRQNGRDLARKAVTDLNMPARQAFLCFSDPVTKDQGLFISGLQEALGLGFLIAGGVSSDHFKFRNLCQYAQEQLLTHAAVGLLIGGSCQVAFSSRHGFKPLGKPRTITKATGNVIRTIDDQPAVHVYEHYLPSEAEALQKNFLNSHAPLYPLGIFLEEEKQYLLRNPVDILADGSIVCQGDVPQGAEMHVMITNKESCRQAAQQAAQEIKDALAGKPPKLVLVLEAISRQRILAQTGLAEIQAIKDVLGYNTPLLGMYTYGEIAPLGDLNNIKSVRWHNGNLILFAIA